MGRGRARPSFMDGARNQKKHPDPAKDPGVVANAGAFAGFLPARLAALTATAATRAEAAATATAARRHRARLVNRQAAPAVLVLVQFVDGALRAFRIAHLDEGESTRLPRRAVANEIDGAHRAHGFEQRLEIGLGSLIGKVTDVKLGAHALLLHRNGCERL